MSKIYIVGIVASEKTTLARKLSIERNISHYEFSNNNESGRFEHWIPIKKVNI